VLLRDFFVRVESPGDVSLFAYDNNTFIVESFLAEETEVRISLDPKQTKIRDLISGEELAGKAGGGGGGFGFFGGGSNRASYSVKIKPHSYRVFGF
jgi:hypothetical protein